METFNETLEDVHLVNYLLIWPQKKKKFEAIVLHSWFEWFKLSILRVDKQCSLENV